MRHRSDVLAPAHPPRIIGNAAVLLRDRWRVLHGELVVTAGRAVQEHDGWRIPRPLVDVVMLQPIDGGNWHYALPAAQLTRAFATSSSPSAAEARRGRPRPPRPPGRG